MKAVSLSDFPMKMYFALHAFHFRADFFDVFYLPSQEAEGFHSLIEFIIRLIVVFLIYYYPARIHHVNVLVMKLE